MLLRRQLAIAVGAVALAAPLSSCGFDYATDRPYTPGAATNDRSGQVDILGATVVSSEPGRGTLVVGFSNNSDSDENAVTGVTAEGFEIEGFETVELPPQGYEQLGEQGVEVTGDYVAGNVLDLTFEFEDGEPITMEVPVVTACDEFEGWDTAAESGSAVPSSAASATPTGEATGEPSDGETYSCDLAHSETSPEAGH